MVGSQWSESSSVRSAGPKDEKHQAISAALTGASLAFGQQASKSTTPSKSYSGKDGALAAASMVVRQKPDDPAVSSRRTSPLREDSSLSPEKGHSRPVEGSLLAAQLSVLRERGQAASRIRALEALNANQGNNVAMSPSNAAALSATARLTPQNSGQGRTASPSFSSTDPGRVSRFIGLQSNTPRKLPRTSFGIEKAQNVHRSVDSESEAVNKQLHLHNSESLDHPSNTDVERSKQEKTVTTAPPKTKKENAMSDLDHQASIPASRTSSHLDSKYKSDSSQRQPLQHKTEKRGRAPAPALPPARTTRTRTKQARSSSPTPSFQSAKSVAGRWNRDISEFDRGRSRNGSAQLASSLVTSRVSTPGPGRPSSSKPSPYLVSHMTGDSLADAIVASSLASSRAPSPTKIASSPPVPKRHSMTHLLIPTHRHESRTPSPPKGMRHTLRKQAMSDGEDDPTPHRKSRKNFVRKHPNKHHEGDRKRWRDIITERERKRYEGVWAANRGILTPSYTTNNKTKEHAADLVLNLVVRDIWSRSRLQQEILEEIWDLVAQQSDGYLAREEFVIGLWLIDQSLKGRKLPIKVSPSVWGSVRSLGQVKIPRHKG